MTTSTLFRVLAVLAFTLALAGCGGSDGDGATSSESSGSATATGAVTIADLKYAPADVTVSAGSEVTWTNDDDAPHTVTFEDGAVASSEELEKGDTFSASFDEAGSYAYTCAIHPDMKATVTVQ